MRAGYGTGSGLDAKGVERADQPVVPFRALGEGTRFGAARDRLYVDETVVRIGRVGEHPAKLEVLHGTLEAGRVLIEARERRLDHLEVVPIGPLDGEANGDAAAVGEDAPPAPPVSYDYALFDTDLSFLEHALAEAYDDPTRPPADRGITDGGVGWRTHPDQGLVELKPPKDLRTRLDALPQSYVSERKVKERLLLATTPGIADDHLRAARNTVEGSTWPEAHYLSPLHPVLDWAADKVLATAGRNQVPAVYGTVNDPIALVLATLMNQRGQVVSRQYVTVTFPDGDPTLPLATAQPDLGFLDATGLRSGGINPGAVDITANLQALIPAAVDAANTALDLTADQQAADLDDRLAQWSARAQRWREQEERVEGERVGASLKKVRNLAKRVSQEEQIAESLRPDQRLVRPLLLIAPQGGAR
jgi:hypothetical protein